MNTLLHPSNRVHFSSARCAGFLKLPKWASPRWVNTPSVGWMHSASRAISPGWLMPASMNDKSWWLSKDQTLKGTPSWLLWLMGLRCTPTDSGRRATTHSFTVVLPLLPVMASTGPSKRLRCALAMPCMTSNTSSATRTSESAAQGAFAWIESATTKRRTPWLCASRRWS